MKYSTATFQMTHMYTHKSTEYFAQTSVPASSLLQQKAPAACIHETRETLKQYPSKKKKEKKTTAV